jgi:hypothetical protein
VELVEITRGHLQVKVGGKSITIYGEAFLREYGSPDFVLYQKSIENWDAPDNKENLTLIEKNQLVQFLKEEFSRRKMFLEIE